MNRFVYVPLKNNGRAKYKAGKPLKSRVLRFGLQEALLGSTGIWFHIHF